MAAPTDVRPTRQGRASTPPGWYDDPGQEHHLRYWDGARWTEGVADGTTVTEAPLPAEPVEPRREDTARLPGRAVAAAVFGIVVGSLMSYGVAQLSLSAWPQHRAIAVALSFLALWTGLAGGCWIASAQWGTGHMLTDLGMRAEGADAIRGFIGAFAARLAAMVVLVPIFLVDRRLVGSNVVSPQRIHDGAFGVVVLLLCGVVGAPIVEELFFRGLLMRSLRRVLGTAGAVIGQAILFGMVHIHPVYGQGNVGIVLGVGVSGLIFGWMTVHSRRLGPSMFAHGFFNLTALLPLLLLR